MVLIFFVSRCIKKKKVLSCFLIKARTLLHFCVKILAQKDWILSTVLLASIYFDNSRKHIKDTTTSDNIVGFKKRHRKNNQFFYRYILKNTVAGPKNQGAGNFFQKWARKPSK